MSVDIAQELTVTEVFTLGPVRRGRPVRGRPARQPDQRGRPGGAGDRPAGAQQPEPHPARRRQQSQNIDPTSLPAGRAVGASNTLRVGDTLPSLTGVLAIRLRPLPGPAGRADRVRRTRNPRPASPGGRRRRRAGGGVQRPQLLQRRRRGWRLPDRPWRRDAVRVRPPAGQDHQRHRRARRRRRRADGARERRHRRAVRRHRGPRRRAQRRERRRHLRLHRHRRRRHRRDPGRHPLPAGVA